jgi:allantoate deiminase
MNRVHVKAERSILEEAAEVLERIEALGRISEEPERLTRTFGSEAMRRANDCVGHWMHDAGMSIREDPIGNLIGHYPARTPDARILIIGSHLDTVRNAGRFDGALGVVLAIACVKRLRLLNVHLPFAIEVIGFGDEEGVRYGCPYLGSRAAAGTFDAAYLRLTDPEGISMADAILRFGGQPERLAEARMESRRLIGYLEAHIEQGPVLEKKRLPVGIVSGIAGQARFEFTFSGQAGHAGTTPMTLRRDPLAAAAEFMTVVEEIARRTAGLVATVGQIQAEPGAVNVIPGRVVLSLDIRHQTDAVRKSAMARIRKLARAIASRRQVKIDATLLQETPSVQCNDTLSALLELAAKVRVRSVPSLPSGAGHDAAIMAAITPVAMLFIRCRDGVSHHPDESVESADIEVALEVMERFLRILAEKYERV